jgi:hypothetical protein
MVDALWGAWNGRGLEHLRLDAATAAVRADSVIIAVDDAGRPFRARYLVNCDARWTVTRARIEVIAEPGRILDISADGHGHWTDTATGGALPLNGCIDIDIFPSPFTNTLPMRRLTDVVAGRPVTIDVAWVGLPDLAIQAVRQEYTLLERGPDSARWRFRALDSGFVAELATDRHGLVLDYPGIARRILDDPPQRG